MTAAPQIEKHGNLTVVRLTTPVDEAGLQRIAPGSIVYLTGTVYTAREGVYKKVVDQGIAPPVDFAQVSNVNFHCSPAARVDDDGGYTMGAVTATASFRFTKWMPRWFEISKARIIIGKGGMSPQDYRNVFVPNGAVYLTTVGYGTGALLGRGITRVREVHWLDELGIAQAMWIIDVQDFGPFIADSDLAGNSLFEQQNSQIDSRIDGLYANLKPPALSRHGETKARTDEVI